LTAGTAWFHNYLYAVTIGGGFMNNPGRYLALTPPINGATVIRRTDGYEAASHECRQ
jgi:hypothetical protein